MVFAIARLHIQMMPWVGPPIIERSLVLCDQLFEKILQHLVRLVACVIFTDSRYAHGFHVNIL